MWYGWINGWVLAGLYTYFRKVEVTGKHNIPKGKPLILGLNHQNAFLDAIAVAALVEGQPYFLVRSDVFKAPIARVFFSSLKMMPVYRERDGVNTVDYNKPIFEKCHSILSKSGQIILFPEGSHDRHKVRRPIKKGLARIAFGAEDAYDFSLDVQVVPIGLNYSQYNKFGSTFHMNIGKPLSLKDYIVEFKNHPNKANAELAKDFGQRLSEVMVDYGKTEFHDALEFLRKMFPAYLHEKAGIAPGTLANDTRAAQDLIRRFIPWSEAHPTEAHQLKEVLLDLKNFLKEQKLHPCIMSDMGRKRISLKDSVLLVFGFPIFVWGAALHYLPFMYPKRFCDKQVKDPVFHSSLKMAFGLAGFSAVYLILFTLGFLFLGWKMGALFMLLVPLSGWVSIKYYYLIRQTLGRLAWQNLSTKKPEKATIVFHRINEIKRLLEMIYK